MGFALEEEDSVPLDEMLKDFAVAPSGSGEYEMTQAEKDKLLRYLNKTHSERWTAQEEARRRWDKLVDYDAGNQAWDSTQGCLVGHEVAGAASADNNLDDKYHIFNIIRRLSGSNVQRLSAFTLQPSVIPNNSDPDNKEGARLGRMALVDLFQRMGEKKMKRRIATIVNKYGSVFQKVYFDPNLGRKVHPLVERPALIPGDPSTWEYDKTQLIPEGEVVLKHYPPTNILLPLFCRSLEDCDDLEEVHVETCNWIWRTFHVKVDAESISIKDGYGPEMVDTTQRGIEYDRGYIKNSVVFRARYINPCPEFIKGAIIFYSQKHIYLCTTLTDHYDSIQEVWQSASAIENEKSPFGDSWLWDIIPVQDSLNTSMSASVNYVEGYGMLQQQASTQSNIKLDKVSNASLRIVTYQGEKGLTPIEQAPLPQTHAEVTAMMLGMSESLGAAHDIRRPEGTPSGNAINSLRQIDDSMLRPCVEGIGEMLEFGSQTALRLIAENYKNPRLMRMMGKEGWEIRDDFTGEMLKGNFNAKISILRGLSDDPGVRQESVLKFLETGIIDSPVEARMLLDMNNTDEMLEKIQKENEIAAKAVKALANYPEGYNFESADPKTGTPLCLFQPDPIDNHELIIQREIEWMRENLRHANPTVKQAFRADLQWRQQWLATLKMPPPPGKGAAAEAMNAEEKFGKEEAAQAGQAPAAKRPVPGATQTAESQPPRPALPPAYTASQQV